jgi:hypothetical protein
MQKHYVPSFSIETPHGNITPKHSHRNTTQKHCAKHTAIETLRRNITQKTLAPQCYAEPFISTETRLLAFALTFAFALVSVLVQTSTVFGFGARDNLWAFILGWGLGCSFYVVHP